MIKGIDWNQPWLTHLRALGERVLEQHHHGGALDQTLNSALDSPVRFVPQSELPQGVAYEQFIFDTGTVPTRDNLHDFFNGLCWLQFPATKKRLNSLQAEQIAEAGVQNVRGPVRDALTLFDENAAFLSAPEPLWDALQARDWHRLFVVHRPLWQQARLVLFGHALLEKLVHPRKAITAHVYKIPETELPLAALDEWVAADLSAAKLAGKPFVPLPVLGVPGWWAGNENFSFYDDSSVFRPRPPPQQA
jgi:hypothetical protein